jgi:hypothetical protein
MKRCLGLLCLLAASSAWAQTRVTAEVSLSAPHTDYGQIAVSVQGTHKGTVTQLSPEHRAKPFTVYGELREWGFFSWLQDDCTATVPTEENRSVTCTTVHNGECGKEYRAEGSAAIDLGLWENGPGAVAQPVLKEPICNYAGAGGPLTVSCDVDRCTPIVLDLGPGGFRFTSFAEAVLFDMNGDGAADRVSWTDPESRTAFLFLDRNSNGEVDDGRELFGAATPQPASPEPNGFAALRVFDGPALGGDGDGRISAADAVFPLLRLWTDADHDGRSQTSEIAGLAAEGIEAIELEPVVSNRRDRYGNELRWTSHVHFARGRRLAAADVIFLSR